MDVISTIVLSAATVFIAYLGVKLYRQKMAQKQRPFPHRMVVAVRRRQAGLAKFLDLPPAEQPMLLNELEAQWAALNAAWQSIGRFVGGFASSEHGLASGDDNEWKLFLIYDLSDYQAFRNCIARIDDQQFTPLRNHCEIRLMLGAAKRGASGGIRRLF